MKVRTIVVVLFGLLAARVALGIEVETTAGAVLTGAVLDVTEDALRFLEQRPREQPNVIQSGDADDLFRAQGHETRVRTLPLDGLKSIAGVSPDTFRVLWKYNLLYRVFGTFESGRLLVTTQGTFLKQVQSVVVFLALVLAALPLAIMLVSWLFPGERLGVLGAVGLVLVFTALGFGAARLSGILGGIGGAWATPTAQVALSGAFVLFLALLVHWRSRFHFFQGLIFVLVWGSGLFLIAGITARLVGLPHGEAAV